MQRGYTYVMVDLRGFGGSNGCLDWAGPGEQADVKAAVEWAARQPWSTGKVGMYGKSYDGVTGLIGEAQQPQGLGAVVSQEPVYDLYRYLYTNGVRYENSLATPALYDAIAGTPGPLSDTPAYNADAIDDTARPGCPVQNYLDQAANSDHTSPYWKQRDLIAETKGHKIPLFLTQGFLENNTKPDGAWDFFNGLGGPKAAGSACGTTSAATRPPRALNDAQHPFFDEVDALLRPAPEGHQADGRRPARLGRDERRLLARRAVLAAGRRQGLDHAAEDRLLRRHGQQRRLGRGRDARPTRRARASGRSPPR